MATNRTNSPTNPVTVADLHAGLRHTLRDFFHGKIDESTVIDRVQFLDMLAYPTHEASRTQEQIRDAREDYQNDDEATVEDFIQALNTIEQTTRAERTTDQIMRELDMARALDDDAAVERLSAELKQAINKIFTAAAADPMNISAAEQATIDANDTICIELAHREALAEDNERDARDWSAFRSQVAVTKAAELEAAHVEALAEDADRTRYPDIYPGTRKSNPEQIDQYAERKAAEAADVREQSDMEE